MFFSFLYETMRINRRAYRMLAERKDEWSFERTVLDGILVRLIALLVCGFFGDSPMRRIYYVFAGTGLAVLRVYMSQCGDAQGPRQDLAGGTDRPEEL